MSELFDIHGVKPARFVNVDQQANVVTFQVQTGPIKEVGVNGCQVDEIVRFARQTIASFQDHCPCRENVLAITKLDEALHWLEHRKADRETRGVEGSHKE